jgi:N-acetylglucosaminyldiphosphoundecaprenol N-acetyl-beta-D-mannosaminyltransferase
LRHILLIGAAIRFVWWGDAARRIRVRRPPVKTGAIYVQFHFATTKITVNLPDSTSLLAAVREKFIAKEGFALATINLDHLVKLRGSEAFRLAYAAQTMVVADGNPIVWLSRIAGKPVSLVPGSDMVLPLARLAAEEAVPLALVGSSDESLATAKAYLAREIPGLNVALTIAPPYGFDPEGDAADQILSQLSAARIGLCFIALGAPKQEVFAARGRNLAPKVGFASVGAGLDFLGGSQTRAPEWVRAIAMEWLWRALSSPRRMIPRYAACAAILPGQALAAWRQRH